MKSSREFARQIDTWLTLKYELGLTEVSSAYNLGFRYNSRFVNTTMDEDLNLIACWIMSDAFKDVDQEIRRKGWPLNKADIEKLVKDFNDDFDKVMYGQLSGNTDMKFIDCAERFVKSVQDMVVYKSGLMADSK